MKRFCLFLLLVAAVTLLLWKIRTGCVPGAMCSWKRTPGHVAPAVSSIATTTPAASAPASKVVTAQDKVFTPAASAPIEAGSVPILEQINREYGRLVRAVLPSVVNINTTRRVAATPSLDNFGEAFPFAPSVPTPGRRGGRGSAREESVGSGVIISREGHIVTNGHVVEQVEEIIVQLHDKRRFKAKVLGVDEPTDLAIIKIQAADLHALPWGDSVKLEPGEQVLAVGNPFGLSESVSHGIVSAKGRNPDLTNNSYEDFIQTTAAINPGNSGGALVNIRGELVGINTAIASTSRGFQGISFAIPSNLVRFVVENLLAKGKVIRGYLGISIEPIRPELQEALGLAIEQGAVVSDVVPGSPSDRAGIQRRDVIVGYQGEAVQDPAQLRLAVSQLPIGTSVKLTFLRDGQQKTVSLKIAELPATVAATEDSQDAEGDKKSNLPPIELPTVLRGVSIEEVTPALARRFGLPANTHGVIVTEVEESALADGKLMAGDLIEEILAKGDRQPRPIPDLASWRAALGKLRANQAITLTVRQGSRGVRLVALVPGKS